MQASDVALVEEKLDLGSRIKVVSLLKRILEKKKDRRRQLRFSVVYHPGLELELSGKKCSKWFLNGIHQGRYVSSK